MSVTASASTNKAPDNPAPPPDTFNRYGKIWAPSDDVDHPLKLNVQFPGVGEMKIPTQDELNVRDKLEKLATLSDADIRTQLDQWPPYKKMKLGDEGQMLGRIQAFKDLRTKMAQKAAHDLGLLTLTPDQQARFEKEYWDKQLQMDRDLAKQFDPIFRARKDKMQAELFRDFSATGTAGPPAPPAKKPSPAPVAAATPKPPSPAPAAPAPPATSPAAPIAQAPMHE